jgi:hypothetical protein
MVPNNNRRLWGVDECHDQRQVLNNLHALQQLRRPILLVRRLR